MDIPVISDLFGIIIKTLYNVFGQNYLLTLFLFALLVKVLLLPLGIKQQKNSIKQARIRPKEMAIRKKYAGRKDQATQQKLNEEIMKLYQEENINPMSGCLPLLIQMPVIFALYGVIMKPLTYISSLGEKGAELLIRAYNAVEKAKLTGYPEIGVIQKFTGNDGGFVKSIGEKFTELAAEEKLSFVWADILPELEKLHDSFTIFGIDLTVSPQFKMNIYILIPILTFLFSFFSTKIIRKFTYQPTSNSDPSQAASLAMMDWMMPLLSVWISFSVSSAIAVYWIFQNILSAAQQILLFKLYPVPVVTDEQIKQAELELKHKGKEKKKADIISDYVIDDYDKTEKNLSKQKKKDDYVLSRKSGISPKVKTMYKDGTRLRARKKI